jgi:hypothetical protein
MGREQDHDTGAGRAPAPADPERFRTGEHAATGPRNPRDVPAEDPVERSEPVRQAPPAEPLPRDTRHPETDRHPAPHIVHEPEPDAGNIMPVKDEPGTL